MKNKNPELMSLLEMYFTEYMPFQAGLSENTIRSYKYAFRLLFKYLYTQKNIPASKVTFQTLDLDTIIGYLDWLEKSRKCSISTRNQRRAALSAFAEYSQNRCFEAAMTFMSGLKKVPHKKQPQKPRTVFTLEEVTALLETPVTGTNTGLRDKVLLNLMYASGARSQEICDLKVRDIQFQDEVTKLTLTGKGNKTRRIQIAKPCGKLLKQYLQHQRIEHCFDRHIFSSQTHEHMTTSCLKEIFKKHLAVAKGRKPLLFLDSVYSPHTMRHSTATHMLEAGVPMMAIKNFLGHSSIKTTERYAELSQGTVNKHIKDWNTRWFSSGNEIKENDDVNRIPDFLN